MEYWEQLLRNIAVYKAKAKLNRVYKSVIDSRLNDLKQDQAVEAERAKERLALLLIGHATSNNHPFRPSSESTNAMLSVPAIQYSRRIDPEPHLKLRPEDKGHDTVEEADFMKKVVSIRILSKGVGGVADVPLTGS